MFAKHINRTVVLLGMRTCPHACPCAFTRAHVITVYPSHRQSRWCLRNSQDSNASSKHTGVQQTLQRVTRIARHDIFDRSPGNSCQRKKAHYPIFLQWAIFPISFPKQHGENKACDPGSHAHRQETQKQANTHKKQTIKQTKNPHTDTHTHTHTQTHRHTDTQTHRHTDTQTHRHADTQTHRHADTQTYAHTHTHTPLFAIRIFTHTPHIKHKAGLSNNMGVGQK